MRILLTTDTIGGVWTFTRDLAEGLLAEEHAVALISFGRSPSVSQSTWASQTEDRYPGAFRYTASEAPLEWMQQNTHAYQAGLADLLRLAESFNPDLIHTSQFCFGSLPLDVPVILTAHSDVLSWAGACDPATLSPTPWLDRYKQLVQQGLNSATTVVAPTNWYLETLEGNFQIPCSRQVILNGQNPPLPSNQPRRLQAVTAGRQWDKAKNLALLNELETPIPILVAGDTTHEHSHAPTSSLQHLGPLDRSTLTNLFQTSTFYIAPSLYEPFGLAPLEAAQSGCVLLLNDLPSFREVWGDAALYFHDADTLSHTMAHILSTKNHLRTIQIRGENRAKYLTGTRMAAAYANLYQTVTSQVLTHA